MGKSPAEWIKMILLGKKPSRSHTSKGREKYTNEKQVLVSAQDSEVDRVVDAALVSNIAIDKSERKFVIENNEAVSLSHEKSTGNQDALYDLDRTNREKAATKAQAAFRGYLARRAFRALKGIIRLQALIRGHLVRRQAVATLNCMLRIVKFQAVIRGMIVRHSDEVRGKCIAVKPMNEQPLVAPAEVTLSACMAKFSANIFIFKLVASSPTAKPLQLHYDSEDQNSVSSWLERWSKTQFWKPLPRPKKITEPKSMKKQINGQISEAQPVRSKRTRRLPGANNVSASVLTSSEIEKPKRNLRKVSSHVVDQVQDNPQNELEKVKRTLRKAHNTVTDNSVQIEAETEKQKEILEKSSTASGCELFERSVNNSNEKMNKEMPRISNELNGEIESEALVMKEIPDVTCTDHVIADLNPSTEIDFEEQITLEHAVDSKVLAANRSNDGNIAVVNGEANHKEDSMNGENQKSSKKVPTPAKLAENRSPTIPSYMAATESAKAKLIAQGSPRFGHETEKNNIVRRHSLPSSTNGKISSQSPRTQRLVQGSGKGGHKTDKSLLASKDGNAKVTQAEWRRCLTQTGI